MTEANPLFRVVLRGYEPAQVDRRIEELSAAVQEAARQRDDLCLRLQTLEEERALRGGDAPVEPASFTHLGERVGQILALAEEEAADLRRLGAEEVAKRHSEIAEQVGQIKGEADRYSANRRTEAETEAARILEDARRLADERIDSAERDAAARIQEAEAVYEEQRARSAKIAADFETTLASRRMAAESELTAQLREANSRLDEAASLVEVARADAEKLQTEAAQESRRLLDDAELQAATIVNDAKALATRVRADSDRELAAATQRRDSINAQLANVRQMLATLTGTSSIPVDPFEVTEEPAPGADSGTERDLPGMPGQPQRGLDEALVDAKEQ